MKNIPIIGKFLSIMALFGVFAVGSTVYATSQMSGINEGYQAVANSSTKAALLLTLSNRYFMALKGDVAQVVLDTDAKDNAADAAAITADRAAYDLNMTAAEAAEPARAADLVALAAQVNGIMDNSCAQAIKLGIAASTPASVAADQTEYLANCSGQFAPVVASGASLRKSFQAEADQAEAALSAQAGTTIIMTLAIVISGLALVMLAAFAYARGEL